MSGVIRSDEEKKVRKCGHPLAISSFVNCVISYFVFLSPLLTTRICYKSSNLGKLLTETLIRLRRWKIDVQNAISRPRNKA